VRRGVRILVTDRQTVVAELREPDLGGTAAGEPMIQLAGLGRIRLPAGPKRPVPESPVHLSAGTSRRILDELRRDEGDRDP